MIRLSKPVYYLAPLIWAGVLCLTASACPTCKESLAENGQAGQNLARGFELSIYLMLAAPAAIITLLSTVFYFQIAAARKSGAQLTMKQVIAQAEANRLPPAAIEPRTSAGVRAH